MSSSTILNLPVTEYTFIFILSDFLTLSDVFIFYLTIFLNIDFNAEFYFYSDSYSTYISFINIKPTSVTLYLLLFWPIFSHQFIHFLHIPYIIVFIFIKYSQFIDNLIRTQNCLHQMNIPGIMYLIKKQVCYCLSKRSPHPYCAIMFKALPGGILYFSIAQLRDLSIFFFITIILFTSWKVYCLA